MKFMTSLICAAALCASTAFADGHANWKSVNEGSSVAFGSVKKNVIGEVHHFSGLSGTVSEMGDITIIIDLSTVETNIDIRNQRIMEHVFPKGMATATLTGRIDRDEVNELPVGDTALVDFEGALALGGIDVDIEAEMLVARLGEDRVLVTTADFIMLSTADLGIDAGIDVLMELANLPGITRVTPISIRMIFEK